MASLSHSANSIRTYRPTVGSLFLLITVIVAGYRLSQLYAAYLSSKGYLIGPVDPFGGDFINLWSTGRLVLNGMLADIYAPEAFAAFQKTIVHSYIGLRLWVYPPHSLLFVGPAGMADFFVTFLAWSALGLLAVIGGARTAGFAWRDTAILALSPSAITCVVEGQTGNVATGLMLFTLAGTAANRRSPIIAAALLTIKPQAGFLLPLLWLRNRRWGLILGTSIVSLALVGTSVAIFGLDIWRTYVHETLTVLSALERNGSGPFLYMIPSAFISMRLLGFDANTATLVHLAFAGGVLVVMIRRLWAEHDVWRQSAILLVGSCLISPYLHTYDLTLLLAAVLIVMKRVDEPTVLLRLAACVAWLLPIIITPLGLSRLPIAPLLVLFVFHVICIKAYRAWPDASFWTPKVAPFRLLATSPRGVPSSHRLNGSMSAGGDIAETARQENVCLRR